MQRITFRLLTTALAIFIIFGHTQAFAEVTNTITSPTQNETITLPASITGTATATDGINEVVVGIRDAVTKLWWNEGSWGNWVLNPAQLTFTNGSTDAQWSYDFDPAGSNGSGEYRVYARTRDINNALSPSTQVSFIGEVSSHLTLEATVISPIADEVLHSPASLFGIAISPVSIDTVLVGIRDVVTKLWWNEGSWGDWVLNPPTSTWVTNPAGINWYYSFDPTGTGGSGQYRAYVRAKEVTGTLSSSVQVPFQVIPNNPPVADAGLDQMVYMGQLISLDGSGSSDPDGDAIAYSWRFSSCPSDCPYLPYPSKISQSFRAMEEGDYVMQLEVYDSNGARNTDQAVISSGAELLPPSNPSLLSREWKYGHYGTMIGNTGLSITDLDNNGSLEIVTTASQSSTHENTMWYVVSEDGNGGYHQTWSSDLFTKSITRLVVADTDANGISEIYIGFDDGTVRIYDGQDFTETSNLKIAGSVSAMAIKDADGDGVSDIILIDENNLYSYSTVDYTEQWQLAGYGGIDIAIGNVDDDLSQEIVIAGSNGHGYVIDGLSRTIQWDYIDGFGSRVRLGNLDKDAREEIIGARPSHSIKIFDAEIRTPAWEVSTLEQIGGVIIVDENNDGIDEIIYGDRQVGRIHCVDAQTRIEKWVSPYSLGTDRDMDSYFGFDDLDSDGIKELVWGSGSNTSGADHLNIVDPYALTLEWQSTDIYRPFSAVDIGDVDDDGQVEIVMSSFLSNSGSEQGILHIFNAQNHALEKEMPVTHRYFSGIYSVRIGDVDNDGENELVVTAAKFDGGLIQVYNGKDLTLENESIAHRNVEFTTIEISDVDNDGKNEIVAGSDDGQLFVFDGQSLVEEWRAISNSIPVLISDIALTDFDNDGNKEIIVANKDSHVSVYDGVTQQLDWLGGVMANSVEINDIDGDGNTELLVGRNDGFIDIFNELNFDLDNSIPIRYTNSSEIEGLKVVDLEQDGTLELIVSIDNKLSVYNTTNFELLWQSNDLGSYLGWYNQIDIGNVDSDTSTEIVFGSSTALFQYD